MADVHRRSRLAILWDAFMGLLAIFSVLAVVWYEQDGWGPFSVAELILLDWIVVGIFAADFVVFLVKARNKRKYLKTTWWDLLGMVPLALSGVPVLRAFRLFRLFRIIRAVRFFARFIKRTERLAKDSNLPRLAMIAATITLVGAFLVWVLERDTNPPLERFGDAVWWAVVTVTTVGYGDITPHTTFGRLVAMGLMLTGIGTIAMLASSVTGAIMKPSEGGTAEVKAEEAAATAAATVPGQLSTLYLLRRDGALTDIEFEAAKARVLHDAGVRADGQPMSESE